LGTAYGAHLGEQGLAADGESTSAWTVILVATYPDFFGRLIGGVALAYLGSWIAVGAAVHSFRSGVDQPKMLGHAAATLGLWFVGAAAGFGVAAWLLACGPAVFLAPAGLFLFGMPLAIPALKGAPEDIDARAHHSEVRVAAGSAVIAGVAILGWCAAVHGELQTYATVAYATAETRGAVLAAGMALSTQSLWMVLVGIVTAALPAGMLMHWDLRYAADARGMATLGLLAALLLATAVAYATAASFKSGIPLPL